MKKGNVKESQAGVMDFDGADDEKEVSRPYENVVFKDVDPTKKVKSKKDVTTDIEGHAISAIQYAEHPIAMDKLYALYVEDETISAGIDKVSKVAASEEITILAKDNAESSTSKTKVLKAENIIKQTYSIIKKTNFGITVKKRMITKEFFRYLFMDYQIYANAYFEVRRSLDGSEMVFVKKDPKKIYVLKDHLGYVEIEGLNKYYYNNYTPNKTERSKLRLSYKGGYIKGTEKVPAMDVRELVQIRDYGNDYYGLSFLYSIAKSSLLQSNAKDLPNNFLKNGMINSTIISFSGTSVGEKNKEEIETKFKYRAVGNKNAGKPIVLYTTSPNSKVEVIGMPKHEFSLSEVKEMYRLGESNVIKRMGIPPEKLSILENSNKATITAADGTMAEEVINPLQSLFEFQMEEILNDDLGLNVTFKFAEKFYNIEQMAKISRTIKGVSINELRKLLFDLPASDDPSADEILVSRSDTTLAVVGEPTTTPAMKDKIESFKDSITELINMRKKHVK